MRPLGDRVIVRRIEEEKSTSLIELPDNAKEKPMEGEVLHVGRGRYNDVTGKRIPVDVKRGDKVLFGKYSGVEIKVKGEELLILREDELLAEI